MRARTLEALVDEEVRIWGCLSGWLSIAPLAVSRAHHARRVREAAALLVD